MMSFVDIKKMRTKKEKKSLIDQRKKQKRHKAEDRKKKNCFNFGIRCCYRKK